MRKLLALLAACSVVLACDTRNGGGTTYPFSGELGTYTLETMSGQALPITLQSLTPGTVRQLTADTIVLSSGGNVREVYYTSTTTTGSSAAPSVGSITHAGKYTITRDSIGLPGDFPYLFGRYTTGTLTLPDGGGFVWVFKRK